MEKDGPGTSLAKFPFPPGRLCDTPSDIGLSTARPCHPINMGYSFPVGTTAEHWFSPTRDAAVRTALLRYTRELRKYKIIRYSNLCKVVWEGGGCLPSTFCCKTLRQLSNNVGAYERPLERFPENTFVLSEEIGGKYMKTQQTDIEKWFCYLDTFCGIPTLNASSAFFVFSLGTGDESVLNLSGSGL